VTRARQAVGFAAHDHVRLRIQISADPVPKERLLVQHQNPDFLEMPA
jgi:hypothetical protein